MNILTELERMSETDRERLIQLAGYYAFFKACGLTPKGTIAEIKDILNKYNISYIDDIEVIQ